MIFTGSRAALLRGHLPTWRNGKVSDYDFHAKPDEINQLYSDLTIGYGTAWKADKPYGVGLYVPDVCHIDVIHWKPSDDLILELDDNETHLVMNQNVHVVSAATQYVLKKSYDHLDIWREKNDQDLAFWEPEVLPLSSQHQALLIQLRSEMEPGTPND